LVTNVEAHDQSSHRESYYGSHTAAALSDLESKPGLQYVALLGHYVLTRSTTSSCRTDNIGVISVEACERASILERAQRHVLVGAETGTFLDLQSRFTIR